jgi:succinoglycan biosynthesis transport protein ExoP
MNQRNLTLHSTLPKAPDDSDSFIDIDRLLAILMRRIGSIALCVGVTVTLALVYLLFSTAQYTSMTQILLDDTMTKYA